MDIILIKEVIRLVGKKTTVGGYSENDIETLTNECYMGLVKPNDECKLFECSIQLDNNDKKRSI